MEATKRPWVYKATAGNHDFSVYSETEPARKDVALVRDFNEANARLIVTACNNFEEMRDALQSALNELSEARRLARQHPSPSYIPTEMVITELKTLLAKIKEG